MITTHFTEEHTHTHTGNMNVFLYYIYNTTVKGAYNHHWVEYIIIVVAYLWVVFVLLGTNPNTHTHKHPSTGSNRTFRERKPFSLYQFCKQTAKTVFSFGLSAIIIERRVLPTVADSYSRPKELRKVFELKNKKKHTEIENQIDTCCCCCIIPNFTSKISL